MNDLIQNIIICSIITFLGIPILNFILKAFWHKNYLENKKMEKFHNKMQEERERERKQLEEADDYYN